MESKLACEITHAQLLAGDCPWCGCPIVAGGPKLDPRSSAPAGRRWDIPIMLAALEHGNTKVARLTILNLDHGPDVEESLPVLRRALAHTDREVRSFAEDALLRTGVRLLAEEADMFERRIEHDSTDFAVRILLLGHYFLTATKIESARLSRQKHVLWVIANAPWAQVAGLPECCLNAEEDRNVHDHAKDQWLHQLKKHPEDTRLLDHAATFFLLKDRGLSESLLKQAQSLDPSNPHWSKRLAFLYDLYLRRRSKDDRAEAGRKALVELENPLGGTVNHLGRFLLFSKLARAAFEAGEPERARSYAQELLGGTRQPELQFVAGDALHQGNMILGRLALSTGDTKMAKFHLLESGRTSGSPVLNSFGPNMRLAKELLELGEREVVIEYLKLCANFWQTNNHQAEQWIYTIEQGRMPDFGANLDY